MKKDATNKNFWQRFAKIYTGFMAKNDALVKGKPLSECVLVAKKK